MPGGNSTGSSMGRGVIQLDVAGNVDQKLDGVIGRLDMIATASQTAADHAGGTFENTWTTAIVSVGRELENLGGRFSSWGSQIQQSMTGLIDTFRTAGIEMQSLESRFRFNFGARSTESWGRVLDIASNTLMSTADVVSQSILLQQTGVDALTPQVLSRTGEMIPALEAMSDLAATKGERGAFLMQRLMQQFFSGDSASALGHLRILFDLPQSQMRIYEEALSHATTAQERFEAFAQITGQLFGGAGRAMADTWEFQMAQLEDAWSIFRYEVIDTFLTGLNPVINFFRETLGRMREIEAETHAFSRAFDMVAATVVTLVTDVLAPLISWTLDFIEENPGFLQAVAAIATAFSMVLTVVGTLLSTFGAVIVSTAAVSAAWATAAPLLGGMASAIGWIVAGFTALAAGSFVVYRAFRENFGGVYDLFQRVTTSVRGLWELMTSVNEDGIAMLSVESSKALEDNGMLQWVIDTGAAFYRLREFASGLWTGLTRGFRTLWRVLGPILEDLTGGFISANMDFLSGGWDDFVTSINEMKPEQWETLGEQIGDLLRDIVEAAVMFRDFVHFIGGMQAAYQRLETQWDRMIGGIASGFQRLQGYWDYFATGVRSVGTVFSEVFYGVIDILADVQLSIDRIITTMSPVLGMFDRIMNPTRAFFMRNPQAAAALTTSADVQGAQQQRTTATLDQLPGRLLAQSQIGTVDQGAKGGRGPGVVVLDGRRVGEALIKAQDRARARVGLTAT